MKSECFNKYFISALSLLMLISCGKNDSGGSAESVSQMVEGVHYRVILQNINGHISGNGAHGTSIFKKDGEELKVKIHVNDAHAGVSHLQSIYSGKDCPTTQHDSNADGVIDALEAESLYGTSVLFLDGDLLSQSLSDSVFPRAGSGGYYAYQTNAKVADLMAAMNQNLSLEGRVLVVHGVRQGSLPATAAGTNGQSAEATLPIACGKIVRVDPEE